MNATREDMMRVITDDGHIWDYMGPLRHATAEMDKDGGYDAVELSVLKDSLDPHYLVNMSRRINRSISLLAIELDRDGQPGAGLAIGGIVEAVLFASYDSQSSQPAMDTIVIRPKIVVPLPAR